MAPAHHEAFEGQGPAASGAVLEKSMSLWQLESLADAAEMESCDSTHMTGVTDQRGVHNIMTNM